MALDVLEQERHALDQQWQRHLERGRYAVRLAQRQYDAVDPENRLVARELEKRWNAALPDLQALEQGYAAARRIDLAPLTPAEQQAVRQLADDLPAVWHAPTTAPAVLAVASQYSLALYNVIASRSIASRWLGEAFSVSSNSISGSGNCR